MELPKKFLERIKTIVTDYDKFIDSYNKTPVKSFFINQNKISEKEFLSQNAWQIEKYANGWKLMEDIKVGKTAEHHSGMIYMQELSAMMPISFLPLKPDDWVIDLCSAPGGKSIQVANKIPNGVLVSNEIVKSRASILNENIERMGLTNVCVTNNEPKEFEKCFGGIFDAVVVDAPCSGEGMFRKDEQAILNWSQENIEACAIRQKAILETANKMLKSGGYLVYSTCTFSIEENEQVVADFCSKYNYDIVPISFNGATSGVKIGEFATDRCLRFYPHRFDGEGQFVALLQKNEDEQSFIKQKIKYKEIHKEPTQYRIFKQFCEQNLDKYTDIISNTIYNNGMLYYCTNQQLAESGVRLINCGVVLGEIKKDRFEPSHNFITGFGARFKNQVDLSNDEAYKFIKGEPLESELSGYVVVKYKGVILGFGKASNMLKNHYPKKLRNL